MGEQVKKREAICYANTMSKKLRTITRTQFAVSAFHIFFICCARAEVFDI